MPETLLVLVGGGGSLVAAFATIRFWLRLRFLKHVYDRGGARDLRAAGSALHRPVIHGGDVTMAGITDAAYDTLSGQSCESPRGQPRTSR